MQMEFDSKDAALTFFVEYMEDASQQLEDFVNRYMKNDGDTETESQRICMLNAIHELDACINGTVGDDIKLNAGDE